LDPECNRDKYMLNLERKTKLPQEDVIKRTKRFFGEGGLGLKLTEETPQCLTFEGGGGFVTVTISSEKGYTEVDLVTQEWDYQVKRFASDFL
jgi:hypothetical protein